MPLKASLLTIFIVITLLAGLGQAKPASAGGPPGQAGPADGRSQQVLPGQTPAGLTATDWQTILGRIEADRAAAAVEPSVTAATLYDETKFMPDADTTADDFGRAVAVEGTTVVIGASGDSLGVASFIGSVYIFEDTGGSWTQTARLTASDGAAYDFFGTVVSISGDTIVVGAPWDDHQGKDSGSVYVYEKGATWADAAETKLTASDASAEDIFGTAVSISGDTVVVGAPWDDDQDSSSGSAYVYEKGATWADAIETKLTASDGAAYKGFGVAVSISGDTVVVGATGDNERGIGSGSIYVYEKGATWADAIETKLTASDGAGGETFGAAVCISGDTIAVGAPVDDDLGLRSGSAYVYEKGATWAAAAETKLTAGDGAAWDEFGSSVSLSGATVVVGTLWDDIHGSAYLYEKGTTWAGATETKITSDDGLAYDYFGYAVSISGDKIVVGAVHRAAGAAYIYTRGTGWLSGSGSQTAVLLPDGAAGAAGDIFGVTVSISGDTIAVGAPYDDDLGDDSGAVYVYEKGATWAVAIKTKLRAGDGATGDYFGFAVSISGDTIVVGAPLDDDLGSESGSAYVYEKGATWDAATETKLKASDGAVLDNFGYAVSISGDTIVVGALLDDDQNTNSGSAYVYEKGAAWDVATEIKLMASDGVADHLFGAAVSISGETIVIGAYRDADQGFDSGSIYVYEKGMDWANASETKLTASDGAAEDRFGYAVSIDSDTVVVGAFGNDDQGYASGSAYVYEKGATWDAAAETKLMASDGVADHRFGGSVSISGDAIAIGAEGDKVHGDYSGAVYVYEKGDNWAAAAETKLTASDGATYDGFGRAVSISGGTIVAGAHYNDDKGSESGSAYVYAPPTPEIAVLGHGHPIASGSAAPSAQDGTDFGVVLAGGGPVTHTFTISNSGTAALTLTGSPPISITGPAAADFTVTTPPASPVAGGSDAAFTLTFQPGAAGLRSAAVAIPNDDSDENPYQFAIQGAGANRPYFLPIILAGSAAQSSAEPGTR